MYVLTADNLSGLGGPMGTGTVTSYFQPRYFYSLTRAKWAAELHYLKHIEKSYLKEYLSIMPEEAAETAAQISSKQQFEKVFKWTIHNSSDTYRCSSNDLFFIMYHVREILLEDAEE